MIQYTHTRKKYARKTKYLFDECRHEIIIEVKIYWVIAKTFHTWRWRFDFINKKWIECHCYVSSQTKKKKAQQNMHLYLHSDWFKNKRSRDFMHYSFGKRNNDREKGVVKTMMNIHSIIRVSNDSTCCAVHSKHVLNAWFRSCCQVEYVCFTRKKMDKKTGNINIYIIVAGNFDSRIQNYILITFQIKKSFITRKPKNA